MQWARVVMVDSMQELVRTPGPAGLRALEIFGDNWKGAGFKSYKDHNVPTDCSRWTEIGMTSFLAECGFPLDKIQTWSCGNRSCVVGNFETWVPYRSWLHSLDNEPEYPVVGLDARVEVTAMRQRQGAS